MSQNAAQTYLRAKVLTATPEQLQLMLYDGAIRFTEQARNVLQEKKFEQSFQLLSKAQKIVVELLSGLKPDKAPELCAKLSGLYNFVLRKLIEANTEHKVESLDEALHILRYQRETWAMLLQQMAKEKAATAASKMSMPAPDARMEATLSRVA
jgi:flagellar secretion chaperone FliS